MEWMDVRNTRIENMISTKKHRYLKSLSDFKPGDKFMVKPLEWFDEKEKIIFGPGPSVPYCKPQWAVEDPERKGIELFTEFMSDCKPLWAVEDPERKGIELFTEFMSEYCGKYMTFVETNPDGTACASEDGGVHLWEDWMVEF